MAQERALPRDVWTGNPEDFSMGGRDNVDAEIIKARFAPDHYRNKTKHFCFFRVTYRTLEDAPEDFTELYRAGFLNSALPTNSSSDTPKEEREPAGGDDSVYNQLADGLVQLEDNEIEEYEGIYLLGKPQKGDDFFVWLGALVECGFVPNGPDTTQFEGLQVHLDRGKGNTYKDKESGEEKASSILLPSAILGNSKSGKKTGAGKTTGAKSTIAKAESKPTTSATTKTTIKNNSSTSLDAVAQAIVEIIDVNGEDGSYEKGKVIVKLTKTDTFKGLNAVDRKLAIDAFNDDSLFTAARGLVYDPDDDLITKL